MRRFGLAQCRDFIRRALGSRFGGLYVFGVLFLGASLLLRFALCLRSLALIDTTPSVLAHMFLVGMIYDAVTFFYCALPAAIFLLVVPDRIYRSKATRVIVNTTYFLAVFALVFDVIAEWLFWGEFGTRYNFVSVDYVAYVHQFTGNLVQALPMPILIGILIAGVTIVFFATRPLLVRTFDSVSSFRQRLRPAAVFALAPAVSVFFVNLSLAEINGNHYNNELSKNGVYSFAAAIRYNGATWSADYRTISSPEAWVRLERRLESQGARFPAGAGARDPLHEAGPVGPETPHNVIVVVMESMGADFVGACGATGGLTPNLDRLAAEGVFFADFYATGTRTDRGLEAVIESLPPTPGRCTIKREMTPDPNALGVILRQRGYRPVFVLGGDPTFDNMGNFFVANGFDVVGRDRFRSSEVTCETAWGVCDGDLFGRIVRECDEMHAKGARFCVASLTCSNHQPFVAPGIAPENRTREAVVKYSDACVGEFIRQAQSKPWFNDTLFVFVADHQANRACLADIAPEMFRIPAIVYAPKLVAPRRVEGIAGQMDLMPTVLGLMKFRYQSRFFGHDVLAQSGGGCAAVSNYQDFGWVTGDRFVLMRAEKRANVYRVDAAGELRGCPQDPELILDATSLYQTAAEYLDSRFILPGAPSAHASRR